MRMWTLKNNLSSGELSPLLWTRTDVQQYGNGAKKLLNALPLVEGGAKKRPGTKFRALMPGIQRIIPFSSNSENAYLLLLGVGILKVYNPRTQVIVWETTTPYDTEKKVSEIQVAHTKYRMFFVQGDTPVHRFVSSADFSNWQFAPFTFSVHPNDDLGTSPNVALTPTGTEVGKTIALNSSAFPNWNTNENYIIGERVIYSGKTWRAITDNKGKTPVADSTDWEVVTAGDAAVFNDSHVGAIVNINGGQVKITSIVSPTGALGEVMVKLNAEVQAIAKSWTLSSLAFSDKNGYPRTVCFFKQRLVFANTKASPNQMWFSRIADDGNYLETTLDADAFSIASSSTQSDNILHLAQRGGVVALTGGSEFMVKSSGALTPASAQIDQHTSHGAQKDVRPIMVGNELLFVQRGGEWLRALAYDFQSDGLVSPELSVIARHITENHGGIKEMAYQQTPNSVVWIVLNDGKVASITLNREQSMNAWAQHDFGCNVLSMCSLPTGLGEDQCFILSQRNENSVLEELKETAQSDCELDILVSQGKGSITNLPLNIINNALVNFSNDYGYFYSEYSSSGTTINLNDPELNQVISIGQPFTFEIDFLPPDYSQVPSTSMFNKVTIHEVAIYLNESIGGAVNGKELSTKTYSQSAFNNKPYTGYAFENQMGWQSLYELQLKITHNKPQPFHLQSISIRMSMNEK